MFRTKRCRGRTTGPRGRLFRLGGVSACSVVQPNVQPHAGSKQKKPLDLSGAQTMVLERLGIRPRPTESSPLSTTVRTNLPNIPGFDARTCAFRTLMRWMSASRTAWRGPCNRPYARQGRRGSWIIPFPEAVARSRTDRRYKAFEDRRNMPVVSAVIQYFPAMRRPSG